VDIKDKVWTHLFLRDQYERISAQLALLEQEAISLIKEIPQAQNLLTIPCIGTSYGGATLFSK
jgi:hypothetical protein